MLWAARKRYSNPLRSPLCWTGGRKGPETNIDIWNMFSVIWDDLTGFTPKKVRKKKKKKSYNMMAEEVKTLQGFGF